MKKILALAIAMMIAFAACGADAPTPPAADPALAPAMETPAPAAPAPEADEPETDADTAATPAAEFDGIPIVLITDYGTIDDGSFNQGS